MNYILSKRKPEIGDRGFIIGNRFIPIQRVKKKIPEDYILYLDFESNQAKTGQVFNQIGTVTYQKDDEFNYARFNGSYLQFFNLFSPGYQSLTVSLWAKAFENLSSYSSVVYISDANRTNQRSFGLFFYGNSGLDFSSGSNELQDTGIIEHAQWNHVVCVQDDQNETSKVYVNGVLVLSKQRRLNLITDRCTIGCNGAGSPGDYFNGYVSSLRIYNRALEDSEIIQLSKEFF